MLETHCFRVYVSLILVYFSLAPCEVGIIIISILQTRKMKIKLLTLDLIFFSFLYLFILNRERQEGKELEDSKGKGRKILEAKQSRKTLERIERESRRIEAVCCGAGK